MRKTFAISLATFLAAATAATMLPDYLQGEQRSMPTLPTKMATAAKHALEFKMNSLDGKQVHLAEKYRGKVVLIVNVASRCGLTGQYKGLQALHEEYAEQGLSVLGFPCNQFFGQEPGSSTEIQAFCKKNYGVEFDMFEKIEVNGSNACDLYKYLKTQDAKPKGAGKISWNFEKFLVDRDGNVIARFGPRTAPHDKALTTAIEAAL
ncbi:MAG: glutathione peroxidase [Pseudomonadota bacterium]